MPDKPTVPLYPPQGIQAELDILYLYSRTALDAAQEASVEAKTLAEKAIALAEGVAGTAEDAKTVAEQSQKTADAAASEVARIQEVIPTQASADNQLADKNFVNSSIQSSTAYYRGDWATYADIPTDVEQYPADPTGNKTPTANDYLVVTADETHEGKTWRYKYTGTWATNGKAGWWAEAAMNVTAFTADQLDALNSGATKEQIAQIDVNRHDISDCKGDISALEMDKQDKLTAGENITIEGNVISATGGGSVPDNALINQGGGNDNSITLMAGNTNPQQTTGGNSVVIGSAGAAAQAANSVRIGALGNNTGRYGISIGHEASAAADGAIQLNSGYNNTPNSLCVSGGQNTTNYMLLKDGLIPSERLAEGGVAGQVLAKTDGGMEWVDGGGGSGLPDQAGHTGYLMTDGSKAVWSDNIFYAKTLIGTEASSIAFYADNSNTLASGNAPAIIGKIYKGVSSPSHTKYFTGPVLAKTLVFSDQTPENYSSAIAIGSTVGMGAANSVMICSGNYTASVPANQKIYTNTEPDTFYWANSKGKFKLYNSDGTIPDERLPQLGDISAVLDAINGENI